MPTLRPTTLDELSGALRDTTGAVAVRGSGVHDGWGVPPDRAPDVVIDMTGLDRVVEHAVGDLVVTVEAGLPLDALHDTLQPHRQWLALDPPRHGTVGGVVASGDCGPRRLRFGRPRDLLLGVTVVLADGTIARSGGKVVKNVAGYDLPKLLTGSFGTLGVITEVTFRLHPLPASTLNLTARSASITHLADLMHRITAAPLSLEAMQLRNEDAEFALDIRLASEPDALRNQEQQLKELAQSCSLTPCDDTVWSARERLFAERDATVLKVSSLPSKLSAIVGAAAILNTQPNTRAHCVAEPTGIATVAFSATPENLATLTDDLRARLRAHGGSAVLLRRGLLPHSVSSWGDPPPAIELMRAIKHEFDPNRILNPGRFVGGI
jgi:glycolate oxidase FAD binding subunit